MDLWVSCEMATCFVHTNDQNVIVHTAPIFRKFEGQSIDNLLDWLKRRGQTVTVKDLKEIKK